MTHFDLYSGNTVLAVITELNKYYAEEGKTVIELRSRALANGKMRRFA
jgi:hypothetical protein